MVLDKRTFEGGMDSDSDLRKVEPGDYRYASSCRISTTQGANMLSVENCMGNLIVSTTLPSGTNTVIGNYEDKENNKVYYFLHNSATRHSIFEYNYNTNTITLVLQNAVLNFSTTALITHADVLEGDLSWTDSINPPREINIQKAKLHTQGNFTTGYPSPFLDEYCRAIRFAPWRQPSCAYADDTTKKINYLSNKLFQFKYRYWYFNYQCSTWSAISTVPLPAFVCGNSSINATKNNVINIAVDTGREIATRIEISARLGNTGDFFSVADLDKTQLSITSNATYSYAFYNEKTYNNVNIKESILLFDMLPLNAPTQEIIENRKIYGNVLEGYDPVNIEAKLSLSYQQDINQQTYGLSFNVFIKNAFSTDADYAYNQPIHNFSNDGNSANYVFGGIGTFLTGTVGNVGSGFFQTIPLGGFIFYLAGTPYYGVSRQVSGSQGGIQDANGVYASDGNGIGSNDHLLNLRQEINARDVYSTVLITGIPPGDYVLRAASHQTTSSELASASKAYQNTSTNVVQMAGQNDTEARIHIDQNGAITVNGVAVSVSNNIASLGESHIVDLTNPSVGGATAITGYLTDCDNQPTPTTYAGLLADTRIERAVLLFNNAGHNFNAIVNNYSWTLAWNADASYTDHNGYFFYTAGSLLSGNIGISSVRAGQGVGIPSDFFNTNMSAFSGISGNQAAQIVTRLQGLSSPINNYRTQILGYVYDSNGNPVEGANVATTHTRVVSTDPSGAFLITMYGPGTYLFLQQANIRSEYICYSLTDQCTGVFGGSPDYLNFSITAPSAAQTMFSSPYSGTYNMSNTVVVTQQTVTISGGNAVQKGDKRGGVYLYGIVYYNDANQSGLTNTREEIYTQSVTTNGFGLKLEIPFYTEGSPIVGGLKPVVSWQIFSRPPLWATHWQWVRTKNMAIDHYIQFVAKKIIPAAADRTPTSFATATKIGIDISNIIDYNTRYTDSEGNVTYDFTKGDRIRFIRDAAGNFYNQYFDFPIRDFDPAGIIYFDYVSAIGQPVAGMEFEIYTPKLVATEQLTYEFGECYQVGNPGTATAYHNGSTQNQDPNNPVTIPATGTFVEGDTYYKSRSMSFLNSSNTAVFTTRIVEDASFSDFFPSKVADIGRPNRIDKNYRQVRRPTTVYHSEIYVPETFINGLNRFYDTSFETYDRQQGSIQRLFADNHVLEIYQVKKCGEVPINQRYIYNAGGDNQLVTTDSFFNEINYSSSDWGIYYNPESFAVYGNSRYFIDLARGVVLRKNIDGLTPISEYKEHVFFNDLSTLYLSNNLRPNIFGVYDKRFDEYVLCFQRIEGQSSQLESSSSSQPLVVEGQTIAFSEKRNRWCVSYPYLPENIGPAGLDIVAFKNGQCWIHNKNAVHNNFFGTQYNSEIWVVSNLDDSKEKVLETLSLESSQAWEAYSITTLEGQETSIQASAFQKLENIFYSEMPMDQNTIGVVDPSINGDPLRSAAFLIKLRNTSTTRVVLRAVNTGLIASERSNK